MLPRHVLHTAFGICLFSIASVGFAEAQSGQAAPVPVPSSANGNPDSSALQEIVVTAEKRSTNLQKTPLAITAISGEALSNSQIHSLDQVQSLVPDLKIGQSGGYAQITVRGIGISNFVPGAESAVALNLNDVYISRPIAQLTGLYDMSSLEVLRGPQGTLYGRNATAGAINVTTARPTDDWSGYANITMGDYNTRTLEGAIGGPLIDDKLLFRVAGLYDYHSGYGRNEVTGQSIDDKKAYGIRATLVAKPNDNLKATLITEYFKENDSSGALHYLGAAGLSGVPGALGIAPLFALSGGYAPTNILDVASPLNPQFSIHTTAVTGTVEWQNGPYSVRSITGYRQQSSLAINPLDGGSVLNALYASGEPAKQYSEELQGHYDSDKLHLTAGLYYFNEIDTGSPSVAPFSNLAIDGAFGIPYAGTKYLVDFAILEGTIKTAAEAAFTQATYQFTDKLSLTAGIRYSVEKKELNRDSTVDPITPYTGYGNVPFISNDVASKIFYSSTPKFGLQYAFTPSVLGYVSYSQGFKSGGYDISASGPAFLPERLTDYEGGIKSTFFDDRFRANVAVFYYDYTDLQVQQVIGVEEITTNAARASIYGIEPELTFVPIDHLTIDGSASYLHARYGTYNGADGALPLLTNIDFSGKTLANSPDWRAHLDATYTLLLANGAIDWRAEADYTSRYYFDPDNIDLLSQSGYTTGNIFITYRPNTNWHVGMYVKNVADEIAKTSARVNSALLGTPIVGSITAPRTAGIQFGYKF